MRRRVSVQFNAPEKVLELTPYKVTANIDFEGEAQRAKYKIAVQVMRRTHSRGIEHGRQKERCVEGLGVRR